MIAVDLSRQQALDRAGYTSVYFILEESKETKLDFAQSTVKVL